ncbi:MAG: PHP domain-containing protein [Nanoarchaeota archaeon]|nr:PHP domain-containing protein [Nanoarchaeota archaeon]MBU1322299.1 PHP domain-containing protein [Nanoarchaeota archaeon]MBU1597838.1 PHP domain-containing protein [Nanoarchaeota archaeon]MBU2441091.1 PHP domain-containing protein [Nanoarchaeota archaeon]
MKNTDLHTHSYYSDGEYSPKDVIRKAKKLGIKNIALTDHCSVSGLEEAVKEGKLIGVEVIPGVEITAKHSEILGYFIDYKNPKLKKILKNCGFYENELTKLKINGLREQGINISYNNFLKSYYYAKGNYNLSHLWHYLVKERGFTGKQAIELVKQVKVKKPLNKNVSVVRAIKIVKQFGGVPVLAHPWLDKEVLNEKNIKIYVKAGLKGIELENGDYNRFGRDKKTVQRIKNIAKKYDLILTVGSDFHGEFMTELSKGHQFSKFLCDEKIVEKLKEQKKEELK